MAKRVQLIRHSSGGADAFTGLNGEITVNTTAKELRLHDSLTAGGIALARKDLVNVDEASVTNDGKMTINQVAELTNATANIAQEIVDRTADVDAEESRALAAEGVLQTNIDNEATTRGNADTTLQSNIDTEEAARIAADLVLQSNIDAIQLAVINAIYSVGSLYIGTTATNPNTILGVGTWAKYNKNRVLISAGNSYVLGTTGGSPNAVAVNHGHTASFAGNQLPNHAHTVTAGFDASGGTGQMDIDGQQGSPDWTFPTSSVSGGLPTGNVTVNNLTGENGTDKNLPPYIAVNIWQRTA